MTKINYAPWDLNVNSFPKNASIKEQLLFFLNFGILAPSAHNSQPWEFSIRDNIINIYLSGIRSLGRSDPTQRQTYISIGCALENILIAAEYYGFKYESSFLPNEMQSGLVATIKFSKTADPKPLTDLILTIPQRRTNRGKYSKKALPERFISQITSLSDENLKILLCTNQEQKNKIADLVCSAQIEAMDSDAFREELSDYVKSNFTNEKTGMPGFTLGIPAPISLFASNLIKKINMSRVNKKTDEKLLKTFTPAFIIIATEQDDKKAWLKAGQILERLWLIAEMHRVSLSPLAGAIEVNNYFEKLKDVLELEQRPQVFIRAGSSEINVRHSPRLDVKSVIRD